MSRAAGIGVTRLIQSSCVQTMSCGCLALQTFHSLRRVRMKESFAHVEGRSREKMEAHACAGSSRVHPITRLVEPPRVRLAGRRSIHAGVPIAVDGARRPSERAQQHYRDALGFEIGWLYPVGDMGAVSRDNVAIFFRRRGRPFEPAGPKNAGRSIGHSYKRN